MDPIKQKFYSERYEKENRNVQFYEKFTPNPRVKTLTGKFYALHDVLSVLGAPVEYVKLIEKRNFSGPKDIYEYKPPSANMDYGWFSEPLVKRSIDERLWFPRKQNDFIKNELKIRYFNRGMPKEKFTGVPFKV